jgi:SAM-dependent methyltransferase
VARFPHDLKPIEKGFCFVGFVFRAEDAHRYNEWFQSEPGRSAVEVEKDLLLRLWAPSSPQRVLEVGCGTGLFLEWFAQLGHHVTGIDPSSTMLDIAQRRVSARITLDRGYAEHLPYDDGAFDTVALITALEFVDDPELALREALRVARRHVLLGTLNKFSLIAGQRYLERFFNPRPSVFSHARFFSLLELHHMVERALAGNVPLRWRTCLSLPLSTLPYLGFLERSRFFQYHPFGHFIAMRIDLVYPLQAIREPLFCELPSGAGQAHFHASCWHFPSKDNSYTSLKGALDERGHVLQEAG